MMALLKGELMDLDDKLAMATEMAEAEAIELSSLAEMKHHPDWPDLHCMKPVPGSLWTATQSKHHQIKAGLQGQKGCQGDSCEQECQAFCKSLGSIILTPMHWSCVSHLSGQSWH